MTNTHEEMIANLWDTIVPLHWQYFSTEETMRKLVERAKLEENIKHYICMIPPSRKFYLPATAHILKVSIMQMNNFSAAKALIGFESISHYANNLFNKPWRKEYRTIKMYSGFYQHEIVSNLKDAEMLFIEMGYKKLSNHTLVLDGPICPDQVSNVSRDALFAYVECRIMTDIFCGLIKQQISTSWADIFSYRESAIGDAFVAVDAMVHKLKQPLFNKEMLVSVNGYNNVSSKSYNTNCSLNHQPHSQSNNYYQQSQQSQQYNGCSVHPGYYNNVNIPNQMLSNYSYVPRPPAIPHSKSMEQYADHNRIDIASHSHSFDQPYENSRHSRDCVDGYQSCNCAPYNNTFNVPGSRCAIPHAISNHFHSSGQYFGNGTYNNSTYPSNAVQSCGHKLNTSDHNKVHSDQYYHESANVNRNSMNHHYNTCDGLAINTPNSYHIKNIKNNIRVDHLMDVEDGPNDTNHSCDCLQRPNDEEMNVKWGKNYIEPSYNNQYTQKDLNNQVDNLYDQNLRKLKSEQYKPKPEILPNYDDHINTNGSRNSRASDFNSYEDVDYSKDKHISNKNQDGVGSYELWNYVYKSLGQQGYNKDLSESGDLLVRGLNLDQLPNNSSEKKHSRIQDTNSDHLASNTPSVINKISTINKHDPPKENGYSTNNKLPSKHNDIVTKPNDKTNQVQESISTSKNNNNHHHTISSEKQSKNGATKKQTKNQAQNQKDITHHTKRTTIVTAQIEHHPEWSCGYCTFLNPGSKKICEMCAKSKDFK